MLLRAPITTIVVLLALSGCATPERCADQQFFKAFVDGKPNPNRYFPGVGELPVDRDVNIRVSICNREAAEAFCVEVYPTEGMPFRFLEPRSTVLLKSNPAAVDLPFKKVSYNVACHGPTLQEKDADCQSSTDSPLEGSLSISKTRVRAANVGSNYYYLNAYEFPPDATFRGANVSATFMVSIRRKYEVVTQPFEPSRTREMVVTLPRVVIGSRTLDVPQVSFRYVTENVCLPNRPLSLQ